MTAKGSREDTGGAQLPDRQSPFGQRPPDGERAVHDGEPARLPGRRVAPVRMDRVPAAHDPYRSRSAMNVAEPNPTPGD